MPELRQRLEGTRRRLLLLPEAERAQLGGLVARLGALAADAESQLRCAGRARQRGDARR